MMHQNNLNGDGSMPVIDGALQAGTWAVAREFTISQEGEYDSTAVWGTPEEIVTVALSAAAPLVAAQALEDAATAIASDDDPKDVLLLSWLRQRAESLKASIG